MEANQAMTGSNGALPAHAQVIIIGGGVIGCSTAYHLAKLGWKDVVILERKQLTSGTTWHAAGLVVCGGFYTETMLELSHYTRELYRNLEQQVRHPVCAFCARTPPLPARLALKRWKFRHRNLKTSGRLSTPVE